MSWILALCLSLMALPALSETTLEKKATFAGGCFWCMEPPFEKIRGVKSVTSGYIGGKEANPTYDQVSSGTTGHVEAVEVLYDADLITYGDLLEIFWRQVNPTDSKGQFVDRGEQYATAIFYHDDNQKREAEASKTKLNDSKKYGSPIVTPIRAATVFYAAEDYHQDYYKKNPLRYKYYRYRSGRDQYLDKIWGKDREFKPSNQPSSHKTRFVKPPKDQLKKMLTSLQWDVTQENATEPAFKNTYWDNKEQGLYVDIVSGEPLFSSEDKYDSGTGWPSFTKPLVPGNLIEKDDSTWYATRTEVRSRLGNSHLGHVFPDGPKPTGLRYCMNSAAMRFIPKDKLEAEGYGEFLTLFRQ